MKIRLEYICTEMVCPCCPWQKKHPTWPVYNMVFPLIYRRYLLHPIMLKYHFTLFFKLVTSKQNLAHHLKLDYFKPDSKQGFIASRWQFCMETSFAHWTFYTKYTAGVEVVRRSSWSDLFTMTFFSFCTKNFKEITKLDVGVSVL